MALGNILNLENLSGDSLSVSTTSSQTPLQTGGIYDLSCDVEMFIAQGVSPTAIVNESYRLLPGATYRFSIIDARRIAAITATGTGTLWFHEVG